MAARKRKTNQKNLGRNFNNQVCDGQGQPDVKRKLISWVYYRMGAGLISGMTPRKRGDVSSAQRHNFATGLLQMDQRAQVEMLASRQRLVVIIYMYRLHAPGRIAR